MATDRQILQTLLHQLRDHIEPDVMGFHSECTICGIQTPISTGSLCFKCEETCRTEGARQMVDLKGLEVE